jgi:hypothetical protein
VCRRQIRVAVDGARLGYWDDVDIMAIHFNLRVMCRWLLLSALAMLFATRRSLLQCGIICPGELVAMAVSSLLLQAPQLLTGGTNLYGIVGRFDIDKYASLFQFAQDVCERHGKVLAVRNGSDNGVGLAGQLIPRR